MTDLPQGPASRRVDRAGLVIAAALAALAVVLVWDSRQLQTTTMYGMGPEVMPVVIAVGLGLLAIGNLIDALRGNLPPRAVLVFDNCHEVPPESPFLLLLGFAAGLLINFA